MNLDEDYGDIGEVVPQVRKQALPVDLPRSLNDRRATPTLNHEEEVYDPWQGQSQFISAPVPAKLNFDIGLSPRENEDDTRRLAESESALANMLASQAALKVAAGLDADEDAIVDDPKLSDNQRREMLQKALNMAASNGDTGRVKRIVFGKAKDYVDIDKPDEEGTSPLIYASCFGHVDVVAALIEAGANVNQQDNNHWSSLMWAMTNRHKGIAKLLLDHGASPEIKSSTGRTAFDFVSPNSEFSDFLHESGYIGTAGVMTGDFYDMGMAEDRFEAEMAENELKRRMMMESSMNLEVDLSSLGLDEQPETPEEEEIDTQEFVWDRCLPDQMFVFQEHELERMLDVIITNMLPQRSASQKPVPANVLFLSARYAFYHANPELLDQLLSSAMIKINNVVERHQWDMTVLAFWISNATLLLHYLKKDTGLVGATVEYQLKLSVLVNDIFVMIVRDAERRMDKVLDSAMLDHETIPGFEDVHFQNEWRLFKSKKKVVEEPAEKRMRPPSPKQKAKPSPRNITSLLSSTLFVLDLYDIHSVIISQVLSQLFYWLGAELFNRIMSNRKYLARTKAMQIRLNVSVLEDWARANNRQVEHYESGALKTTGEAMADAAKRHLEPVIQLLQWLQCFSSLGDDRQALQSTMEQLPRLTAQQLVHATRNYRNEVGEKGLPRDNMKYLVGLHMDSVTKKNNKMAQRMSGSHQASNSSTPNKKGQQNEDDEGDDAPEHLLMDSSMILPFSLPSSVDMLVSFGAGIGGVDREREKKYQPSVPPEYVTKLDFSSPSNRGNGYESNRWDDD